MRLERLAEAAGPGHAEARQFCLDTIAEVYGIAYRPDWHADLDSLTRPGESHYRATQRGAFWTLRDASGAIAATAGVRHLGWKPNVLAMFPERYAAGEEIASLWRVYVRKDVRRRGLGRRLTSLCERQAGRLGYRTMYLHASSDASATLAFWNAAGYRCFGTCESSSHFDKQIGRAQPK